MMPEIKGDKIKRILRSQNVKECMCIQTNKKSIYGGGI